MSLNFLENYRPESNTWDEMFNQEHQIRTPYKKIIDYLANESAEDLNKKEDLAKRLFMSQGITFTVYNSGEGIEKIFPFDIIPRILTAPEWEFIEKGIKERL